MGELTNWISVIVALVAALVSIIFARRAERFNTQQYQLGKNAFLLEYSRELRQWADEVVLVMTEAVFLCDLNPARSSPIDFFEQRHHCRLHLSALLDRGRFFFPNEPSEQIGEDKEVAYRGLRPRALDLVEEAYNLCHALNFKEQSPNLMLRPKLVAVKRNFVAEIQRFLDPREFEREIKTLRNLSIRDTP